jgi:hypothetical protein
MGTSSLNFTFNPFAFDDLYQVQQVARVSAPDYSVNLLDNQNSGGASGAQTDASSSLASETASVLDGASLTMSDSEEDTSSYIGTLISVYA